MKQDNVTFDHNKVLNIYIIYEISKIFHITDYPTLENCLFGAVTSADIDIDRCKYSVYEIGFSRHRRFSFPGTGLGRNVVIFWVDMSSSEKMNNREKDILI